ncbi:MAG: phosphohydrolase, partial [Nitrospinaceae bacterium]
MAVTDIAEALTAADRPYKKAMPLERVYQILQMKADRNELDPDMVEFFIKSRVYEKYQALHEAPDSPPELNASLVKNKNPQPVFHASK